jgi:hypothetical protein
LPQAIFFIVVSFVAKRDIHTLKNVSHDVFFLTIASPLTRHSIANRAMREMNHFLHSATQVPFRKATATAGTVTPNGQIAILSQKLSGDGQIQTGYVSQLDCQTVEVHANIHDLLLYFNDTTLLYYSYKRNSFLKVEENDDLTPLSHLDPPPRSKIFRFMATPGGQALRVCTDTVINEIQDLETGAIRWSNPGPSGLAVCQCGHRFVSPDTFFCFEETRQDWTMKLFDTRTNITSATCTLPSNCETSVFATQLSTHSWMLYRSTTPTNPVDQDAGWFRADLRQPKLEVLLPPWYTAGSHCPQVVETVHVQKIHGWLHYFVNARTEGGYMFNVLDVAEIYGGFRPHFCARRSWFIQEAAAVDAIQFTVFEDNLFVACRGRQSYYGLLHNKLL